MEFLLICAPSAPPLCATLRPRAFVSACSDRSRNICSPACAVLMWLRPITRLGAACDRWSSCARLSTALVPSRAWKTAASYEVYLKQPNARGGALTNSSSTSSPKPARKSRRPSIASPSLAKLPRRYVVDGSTPHWQRGVRAKLLPFLWQARHEALMNKPGLLISAPDCQQASVTRLPMSWCSSLSLLPAMSFWRSGSERGKSVLRFASFRCAM